MPAPLGSQPPVVEAVGTGQSSIAKEPPDVPYPSDGPVRQAVSGGSDGAVRGALDDHDGQDGQAGRGRIGGGTAVEPPSTPRTSGEQLATHLLPD